MKSAEVTLNDRRRPRKNQGYRRSRFGRPRRSRNVRGRNHWHPGRHNGWSIHSGVDHVRYARRRLVAARMGLARMGLARMGLATRMGLAPRTLLALGLVLSTTRQPFEKIVA